MDPRRLENEPPPIRRPLYRIIWTVRCFFGLIVAAPVALAGYYWYDMQTSVSVGQIQDMAYTSGPPPGSTIAEVEGWLDAHGISHFQRSRDWRDWYTQTPEQVGGPQAARAATVVVGVINHANVNSILKGDIYLFFYMDGDGRLFMHFVRGWVPLP